MSSEESERSHHLPTEDSAEEVGCVDDGNHDDEQKNDDEEEDETTTMDTTTMDTTKPSDGDNRRSDSASSGASFSSPTPSSASPAPKTIVNSDEMEATMTTMDSPKGDDAAAVDWETNWNGLEVDQNGEYFMSCDFSNGSVVPELDEGQIFDPCYVGGVPMNGGGHWGAAGGGHLLPGPALPAAVHVHNHTVCSAGGGLPHAPGTHSPHMHSPGTHSIGGSPYDNGAAPVAPQQYVVNVHVNPGETFSVRVGDEVQLIQGPATVRMVSNSGPPMPMPMQVPPGHMVQQIVDENGILTHVILSPQLPSMPTPPMMGAPNGTPHQPMYQPYGQQYPQSFPSHFAPHHHPIPPRHFHSMGAPHVHRTTPPPPPPSSHQYNSHGHRATGGLAGPHGNQIVTDFRAQRVKARLQEKVIRRKVTTTTTESQPRNSSSSSGCSSQTSNPSSGVAGNNANTTSAATGGNSSSTAGQDFENECQMIRELLSNMQPPEVSAIESRRALVHLTPPKFNADELDIDPSEFFYQLKISDKKGGNYAVVYDGADVEIPLSKLVPATEYFLRALCRLDDIQGAAVDATPFCTLSSEPDPPAPPKLVSKTKTNIQLKWNSPADNGSKITSYYVEYSQGVPELSNFTELYNGPLKTFKVNKLSPSTTYVFRLAAINAIGKSDYSEPAMFCTTGTVPSQTDPPMLSEQDVKSLTISWIKRPSDDSFTLQMDDDTTGHGFLNVYNGSDLSYKIPNLRRNSEYKFRLQASNDEGSGRWSDVVTYKTLPDRPQAPPKPQVKGKASSNSFKIIWDAPTNNGGAEIINYFVQLDDGSKKFHVTGEREFSAENLQPGCTYHIRVQAVGPGGVSDWSEAALVTTQAVCPGICKPPRLHGRPKPTYLNIMWELPAYDGGSTITEYAALMIDDEKGIREVYRGHDTDCAVAGLLPGRTYSFQVKAFNKAGAGPWSESLEVVTSAGIPDSPRQPDVYCKSPHVAIVSWEEPSNNGAPITEYRLEWQPKDEPEFIPLYCGAALTHEVTKLSPAAVYSFRIQAVNCVGSSPFSAISACQTPPSSPGAVVSLRACTTSTSVELAWKEPSCNGSKITSYNIDIGERQAHSIENLTSYTIDDLLPETTYKVRIQAANAIGVGPFSPAIKVTTRALPPNPPYLECVTAGPKFLKLKWGDGKNPDLIHYCLEMMRDNGSFQPVYQGSGQTHKVTRLNEQADYRFRIYAINDAGDGPMSQIFTFSTTKAPPTLLKSPKVSDIGLNSCVVEWIGVKLIGHDNIVYVVQMQHSASKDPQYKEVYRGAEQTFLLNNLLSRTEYQVRVCAVRQSQDGSGDLVGPYSGSTVFTTSGAKLTSPSSADSSSAKVDSKGQLSFRLSDQQWAFIILVGFAVFAVIVAFGAKHIIDRTSSNGNGNASRNGNNGSD